MIFLIFLTCIFIFYSLNKFYISNTIINEFNFFFVKDIIVFSLIGYLIVYFGFNGNSVLKQANLNNSIKLVGIALLVGQLSFLAGIILARKIKVYSIKGVSFNLKGLQLISWASILSTAIVLIFEGIPQKLLFLGLTELDILGKRLEIHYNGSPTFIRNIFSKFLGSVSLLAFILGPKSFIKKNKITFFVLILCGIYNYTLDLTKSHIVLLFIAIIIALYRNKKASFIKAFFLTSLTIVFLIIIFTLLSESNLIALDYLWKRVFVSQISPLFLSIYIFGSGLVPSVSSVFFIRQLISRISEIEILPPGRILMEYAYPEQFNSGIGNYLSTIWISDAFAIYGWLGILIFGFIVGFSMIYTYRLLNKIFGNVLGISIGIHLLVFSNYSSSVLPFVINPKLIILTGFLIIIFYTTNLKNEKFYSNR